MSGGLAVAVVRLVELIKLVPPRSARLVDVT